MLNTVVNAFLLSFELRVASIADDGIIFAYLPMCRVVFLFDTFSAVFAVYNSFLTRVQMVFHKFSLHRLLAEITLDFNIRTCLHMSLDLVLIQLCPAVPESNTLNKLEIAIKHVSFKLIIIKNGLTPILHIVAFQLQLWKTASNNLMTLLLDLNVLWAFERTGGRTLEVSI